MEFWENLKNNYLPDILESFAIAMAISVFVYYIFLIPNIVEGDSMKETFHDKDLLFTNHLIQWLGDTPVGEWMNYDYQRQDIIIFTLQNRGDLIKRVIGLPGDKIKIADGIVYVNNEKIEENYLSDLNKDKTYLPYSANSWLEENVEVEVPANKYFVLGDNRQNSKDSRVSEVGFVSRENIKGKVLVKYWPINDFKFFNF